MAEDYTREEGELSEEETAKLYAFVVEQIQNGLDDAAIERNLAEMGMSRGDAAEVIAALHADLVEAAEAERPTGASLLVALAGGAGAAVLGGVIWGFIIIATGYGIGFLAWGMGGLAGFAVLWITGGKRGVPYQGIAALSAVLGIVVGKYFAYVHSLKEAVREQLGEAAASDVSWFSKDVIDFFIDDFTIVFSGWDTLWVGLAVYTAWRIPKGLGLLLPGRQSAMQDR